MFQVCEGCSFSLASCVFDEWLEIISRGRRDNCQVKTGFPSTIIKVVWFQPMMHTLSRNRWKEFLTSTVCFLKQIHFGKPVGSNWPFWKTSWLFAQLAIFQPCEVKCGLGKLLCEVSSRFAKKWEIFGLLGFFLENHCYPQGLPHQNGRVNNNFSYLFKCASILCIFQLWVALVGAARSAMVDGP